MSSNTYECKWLYEKYSEALGMGVQVVMIKIKRWRENCVIQSQCHGKTNNTPNPMREHNMGTSKVITKVINDRKAPLLKS